MWSEKESARLGQKVGYRYNTEGKINANRLTGALPAGLRPGGRLLNAAHCAAEQSAGSGLLCPPQPLTLPMVVLAALIGVVHSVSVA